MRNNTFYPESLKSLHIWALWKLETDSKGRPTKVPYSTQYNGKASSTNPRSWGTFDQAMNKLEAHPDEYNGIALVISKEYGLVFIDIDNCINEEGEYSETAMDIVSSFGSQFMEYSQSGTGIHIITKGRIPKSFKNSGNGVEMYDDKRFCALTGNALYEGEPKEEQSVIDEIYQRYKTVDKPIKRARTQNRGLQNDDKWVIQHAEKNPKFMELYSGKWEQAGYNSQSEADLSLCGMLAFWTDCNTDQIDRIFKTSGLYRDKWDRDDYRESTISMAVSQCSETISEYLRRNERERGIDLTKPCRKGGTISYNEMLKRIEKADPYNDETYRKKNDVAIAKLFSDILEDRIRFNATAKTWFYYDGRVWKQDTESLITESCAKTFFRAMQVYSAKNVEDSEYSKFIAKYGDRPCRKRMIEDARDYNFIEAEDLDQDPMLFNCQNCVIDLNSGKQLEHDPTLLLSKISNVIYDPEAISNDFTQFLNEIMQDDREKIEYLQKIFGYCLTGENTQEECYMFYGPTTRNGKSTLLDVVGYLFGDYAMNTQPETLAMKDKNSRSASGDIARLSGCRLLHMSEPPKRMKFDVALLKTMLGRDPITARHIYEREFEFVPVFKLIINTNFLPVVTDDTLFSSGRVKVITFDRHFEPEEQDPKLKKRLKAKDNISGIFNWVLEGLTKYMEEGEILIEPESVVKATEDYRYKSDKIQNWIDDCLRYTPGLNTSIKDAYENFSSWCDLNGFGTENKGNWIDEIKVKGLYSTSGTINSKTVRNVIRNYSLLTQEENLPSWD